MMGGFNGKLCAQWVCSMGKYFGCCWEYYCVLNRALLGSSMGMYYMLNGKVFWMLLGKLMVCSMDNYNVLNWTLFGCSMGSDVFNGKLNVLNWTILGCSMGSYMLNRKL